MSLLGEMDKIQYVGHCLLPCGHKAHLISTDQIFNTCVQASSQDFR